MNAPAIQVERLGKSYRIGQEVRMRRTVSEAAADVLRAPLRRLRSGMGGNVSRSDTVWALREVSFVVEPGQVVGVIGRNGAGKSTLLKLLSRITDPTEGYGAIRGRVASLLEVGTGFHPELTGRENIFFNGAILGMTRREIRSKFGAIVAFADIGKFLDTPVKRYSSGMQVRLAFAVAAHLEPEILLVDEVLAVGDVGFQKKCLGKMQGVSRSGRTILFVSHNLAAVQQLCDRCIVLDGGNVLFDGDTAEAVSSYLRLLTDHAPPAVVDCAGMADKSTNPHVHTAKLRLLNARGEPSTQISFASDFTVEITIDVRETIHDLSAGLGINSLEGVRLFTTESRATHPIERIEPGIHVLRLDWRGLVLRPGLYSIDVGHNSDAGSELLRGVTQVEILETTDAGSRAALDRRPGLILNTMNWTMEAAMPIRDREREPCALQ